MSKQNKVGRPPRPFNCPSGSHVTINDFVKANPDFICRLSIYTNVGKLVKQGVYRYTGKTQPTGGVGKPLKVLQTMKSFRLSRAAKRAAKLRNAAPVDLTPVTDTVAA